MGIVHIPITVQNGTVQPVPLGIADRINQTIVWIINNPENSGITFANPPVEFGPVVSPFTPWPGTTPTQVPGMPDMWVAEVNQVVPVGELQIYKYDVVYKKEGVDQRLDPDIANQGYPPSGDYLE